MMKPEEWLFHSRKHENGIHANKKGRPKPPFFKISADEDQLSFLNSVTCPLYSTFSPLAPVASIT